LDHGAHQMLCTIFTCLNIGRASVNKFLNNTIFVHNNTDVDRRMHRF